MKPEITYFDLQAYVGTTKHLGGLDTTKELIGLCHIDQDSYVLDIGCGVGATACYLAKNHGCRVMGIDLHQSMVDGAIERANREGVTDRVAFRVADAKKLPFEDDHFDAVLCESVATFIKEKQDVVDQAFRVLKPEGYAGFNEEIWLKDPPPELVEETKQLWEIKPDLPKADRWREILAEAGFQDLVIRPLRFDTKRESTQIQRYRPRDMWTMTYRTIALFLKSPEFRGYMKERRLPKRFFEYLGYGLFVGRKG
jgi:arsenite methyltransferase